MPAERLWLLALLAAGTPLAAAPPEITRPPDDARRDNREAVSPELLEFLGSWETATGTWNETIPDNERAAPTPARRPKETRRDKD